MATAARSRTFRMFPPAGRTTFTTQRGQKLDATTAGYVDAVTQDAEALQHAGWTRVVEVGPTANRPLPGASSDIPGHIVTVRSGYPYLDTTLGSVVFYSAAKGAWVDQSHTAA